ncbi:hypothetical protein BDY19DRAFT_388376 [Irpex rosettiformis]|uniref:Uncharacterized protein n=1 Tax=Irpex rosettiformis TaxID=378272 RepID=A0ACB8TVM3_9APHY|nr:hypothetical protein BDY19DRAFT_388376 [Irpex rosettiformis]
MQLYCTPSKPRFQPIEFVRLGQLWQCMHAIKFILKSVLFLVFLIRLWAPALSGSMSKLHRPFKCSATVKFNGRATKMIIFLTLYGTRFSSFHLVVSRYKRVHNEVIQPLGQYSLEGLLERIEAAMDGCTTPPSA